MGKAKRVVKQPVPAPQSIEEAIEWLTELAAKKSMIAIAQEQLDALVIELNKRFAEECAPVKVRCTELLNGLHAFFTANRQVLSDGKTKMIRFSVATISWRQRPPSARLSNQIAIVDHIKTQRDALRHCLDQSDLTPEQREDATDKFMAFSTFLRVKTEIDKDALLRKPDLAKTIPGVKIGSTGEDFIIKFIGIELDEVVL
jgi:phage host-nuclease inhibitor protein Gam